ncbi:dihydropteroate synthase [Halobacteriovorax sp. XZX-3]|uniref:dihydropteroate synthase n=1 Tax=unclassified Halobacteriovorax TaxID=2639665 RepID=UPI003711858A
MTKISFLGVVNTTPNSFSDGHLNLDQDYQIKQLEKFKNANYGIDIGAESSAPFNDPVSLQEEWARLDSYLFQHLKYLNEFKTISIDTYKPETMRLFLDKYAKEFERIIWNDVSGVIDDKCIKLLKDYPTIEYVLCHTLVPGRDKTLEHMNYLDPKLNADSIKTFFKQAMDKLQSSGIASERIILDPCFGFSKTTDQNLNLLDELHEIQTISKRWLIGISKKSFLRHLISLERPEIRDDKQALLAASEGPHWMYLGQFARDFNEVDDLIFRVHEVGKITKIT